jgi:hypothetical protein
MPILDYCQVELGVNGQIHGERAQTYIAPVEFTDSIKDNLLYTTGAKVDGGANQVYAAMIALGASASATISLSNFTDILNEAGQAFNLVKAIVVTVLSPRDDVNFGTIASGVSFGPAAAQPWQGFFGSTTDTVTVLGGSATVEGGEFCWATTNAAGYPVVAGSSDQLAVTNLDGVNAAHVVVVVVGAFQVYTYGGGYFGSPYFPPAYFG